jgi:sugar phosphate isomerase/epimerase
VNRKNFGICLDIGHVIAYSKFSLEDWISNLGNRIKYIHLHWNNGTSDDHHKPTEEELIILRQLLNKYEINPIVTMEYGVNNISEEVIRLRKYVF